MPPKLPAAIKTYYDTLAAIEGAGAANEGATRSAFQNLLAAWGQPHKLTVLAEQTIDGSRKRPIRLDGILVDAPALPARLLGGQGYRRRPGRRDDQENRRGLPAQQHPVREHPAAAVLYQDGARRLEADLRDPAELPVLLDTFVTYEPAEIEGFHRARGPLPRGYSPPGPHAHHAHRRRQAHQPRLPRRAGRLPCHVPQGAQPGHQRGRSGRHAQAAYPHRAHLPRHLPEPPTLCAATPWPPNSRAWSTPSPASRSAATSSSSRFDYFYRPIEDTARHYRQLRREAGLARHALRAILPGVFDPRRRYPRHRLHPAGDRAPAWSPPSSRRWGASSGCPLGRPGRAYHRPLRRHRHLRHGTPAPHRRPAPWQHKYSHELHANEVLLLPYYIAAQNIEHAFYERTGQYAPFPGICFADTLDLMDAPQLVHVRRENSQRIEQQKLAPDPRRHRQPALQRRPGQRKRQQQEPQSHSRCSYPCNICC